MKRTIATLLTLAMVLGMMFVPAYAETEELPPLPVAEVTELDLEALAADDDEFNDLTYGLRFSTGEISAEDFEAQYEAYADWYADFVLTLNKDVKWAVDDETADGYLAGCYGEYGWIPVPPADKAVTLAANEPVKIMEKAAELFGSQGLRYTCLEVYEAVQVFDCGVYLKPEYLAANPDLQISLELRIYNPENEEENYLIGGETYEFEVVALPTATVTELDTKAISADEENGIDLTYGLRFEADDATEEQVTAYGDWFADFVLTVNKDVTFNAEGTQNGYLAGNYGDYGWIPVPPTDMFIAANEPVRIMATAAEVLGQPGLNYTYNDVLEAVGIFDCGVFFTPEFLAANPDLEVTLELRIYHPEADSVNYVIGDTHSFVTKAETTEDNVEIQGSKLTTGTAVTIQKLDLTSFSGTSNTITLNTNMFVADSSEIVDTITIPATAFADVEALGEDAVLNITFANAANEDITVSLDKNVLAAIQTEVADVQEDTDNLTIKVEKTEDITDAQANAIKDFENKVVYKIVLATDNGAEVSIADAEGDVVVTIPYEESEEYGDVKVKELTADAKLKNADFTFENEAVTLTVADFGKYVIYQESVGGNFDNTIVVRPTTGGSGSSGSVVTQPVTPSEDVETPAEDKKVFADVAEDAWYYGDIAYAIEKGLVNGVSETEFAPDALVTRAMFVTILYRNEGEPATNRSIPFADIDMAAYYANAVVWAQQNEIVKGVSETEFAPDANITREQMAAIMFRYAQYKGMEALTLEENLHFADANEISEYAVSAMNWAVGCGLMNGKSESTIAPQDNATRAECAAILHRFFENNK